VQISSLDDSTAPRFADRVAAASLDAFESHAVFRCLLDSIARPGDLHQLPAALVARFPAVLLPVVALADVDVPVTVCEPTTGDGGTPWGAVVAAATGAPLVPLPSARMVATFEPLSAEVVRGVRSGTALAPELGCRLVSTCTSIHVDHPAAPMSAVGLIIRGPGIDGIRAVSIDSVPAEALAALAALNDGRPAGVDTWFVTPGGQVLGLPRSTRIELIDVRGGN
jgi:alpha-D-ribose 1-methylphosphonate 5-triphosphate synthase subunit PhnH